MQQRSCRVNENMDFDQPPDFENSNIESRDVANNKPEEHRAQILIGRESLQSHVSIFSQRPMIIFENVNKSNFLQNLGHF